MLEKIDFNRAPCNASKLEIMIEAKFDKEHLN